LPAAKPSTHAEFGVVYGVCVANPDTNTTARPLDPDESLGFGLAAEPQATSVAAVVAATVITASDRASGDIMASGYGTGC
jgi:hypothetical protein